MHERDFELAGRELCDDGKVAFCVRIIPMGIERRYLYDPPADNIWLDDEPILVSGHDMTSITGKRVREWLRATQL